MKRQGRVLALLLWLPIIAEAGDAVTSVTVINKTSRVFLHLYLAPASR